MIRCDGDLERFTWELPIESLHSISGKSGEPGRHNPTPQFYTLSFPTRTKWPGSSWHIIFSEISQVRCPMTYLLCSCEPPCWRRVTLCGQSAQEGESGRTERSVRGLSPVERLVRRMREQKISIANCCQRHSREYGVDSLGRSCHLSWAGWKVQTCGWFFHGEQSVPRRGGARKEWEAAHEGPPDLRCSVSTPQSSQLFQWDNSFPYKSRHQT